MKMKRYEFISLWQKTVIEKSFMLLKMFQVENFELDLSSNQEKLEKFMRERKILEWGRIRFILDPKQYKSIRPEHVKRDLHFYKSVKKTIEDIEWLFRDGVKFEIVKSARFVYETERYDYKIDLNLDDFFYDNKIVIQTDGTPIKELFDNMIWFLQRRLEWLNQDIEIDNILFSDDERRNNDEKEKTDNEEQKPKKRRDKKHSKRDNTREQNVPELLQCD